MCPINGIATHVHEGRKVRRELLGFDRDTHNQSLSGDHEMQNEIEKALKLGLPRLQLFLDTRKPLF